VIEEPNQNRERELEMLRKVEEEEAKLKMEVLRKIGEEEAKLKMEVLRKIGEEKAKFENSQKQRALTTKMAMLKRSLVNLESENNQLRDRVQSQSSSNLDVVDQREVDQTYGEVIRSLTELRTENEERNEEVS